MNIFLIEDDEVYAEFVCKSLNSAGDRKIAHFASAEAALEALNGKSLPDAFIIDYKLPGMTGISFYEKIKHNINDSHKVIMLSALDDGQMVLSFIQKGVRDYVIKDENVIESLNAILEGNEDEYYLFK